MYQGLLGTPCTILSTKGANKHGKHIPMHLKVFKNGKVFTTGNDLPSKPKRIKIRFLTSRTQERGNDTNHTTDR